MADINRLIAALKQQDFKPEDSKILSSIMHPVKAAEQAGQWFQNNVNTAAGYSDPYDNPTPWLAPSDEQQTEAALNLSGLMQTGSMPFAPKSAGGTLGTVTGYGTKKAKQIADLLNQAHGKNLDASITGTNKGLILDKLIVDKANRGKGIGSGFLNDLIEQADDSNTSVFLDALGDFGGSKKRQIDLYKRFGFVENKGRNKDYSFSQSMYRTPIASKIMGEKK